MDKNKNKNKNKYKIEKYKYNNLISLYNKTDSLKFDNLEKQHHIYKVAKNQYKKYRDKYNINNLYLETGGLDRTEGNITPAISMSPELLNFVKCFYGLSIIGEWFQRGSTGEDPLKKLVNYSNNSETAVACMNETTPCSPPCVEKVNSKKCFPNDVSEWWINNVSLVNSESDGKVYRLLNKVAIKQVLPPRSSLHKFIVELEPVEDSQCHTIFIFPSGLVTGIPLDIRNIIIPKIINSLQTKNKVLVCGHSMGGLWTQVIAYCLIISGVPKELLDKLYIITSGSSSWATNDMYRLFTTTYDPQKYIFFCNSDTNKGEKYIDPKILIFTPPNSGPYFNTDDSDNLDNNPKNWQCRVCGPQSESSYDDTLIKISDSPVCEKCRTLKVYEKPKNITRLSLPSIVISSQKEIHPFVITVNSDNAYYDNRCDSLKLYINNGSEFIESNTLSIPMYDGEKYEPTNKIHTLVSYKKSLKQIFLF